MQKISPTQLTSVVGGATPASKGNDQITQQLTALSSSIKDIASSNNNSGGGSNTMMMMAMMMAMRPQPTVIAAGGPAPAAAPGAVVNISTRVRR